LMQAFQAMQLGNDMLGPAVPSDPSISNLADVYRSNLMTYGQTGYDADYGYPRALGPPVEAALPYPGYAPLAPPTPFPTFPTASNNTSAPYNAPFTQSLSQSSHPHAQAPVVPDHIARAAEAEVHQMIANRHLNPVDFHCEPENVSLRLTCGWRADPHRPASLLLNHSPRTTCTSRSSMRFGRALRTAISVSTRRSKRLGDRSTCSFR
jgi:hypothetical protein